LILHLERQIYNDDDYKIELIGFKIPESITKTSNNIDFETKSNELSRREKNILPLILDGLTNEEIANKLHISKYTADGHRCKIYKKLGVHSFKELVKVTNLKIS
jgi:DNA-binding NarL/FixJ family response regulator